MPTAVSAPVVSIVIPCRNEDCYIEECLRGVLAFDQPPGGFEVIVADGMSDDGTRNIVSRIATVDPRVRLLDNPKRNTPCALNVGIRAARGEIIVRVDAHTEYARDYLCRCVEVLQETGADNVGGPWVAKGKSYLQRAIAAAFASPFAVGGARGHRADFEGPVDTVYLGCWRKSILERIGLFDEELIRNQDDELNFRLQLAGGKIWQSPRIRSWYTPRASLRNLFRQYWQYGYWKVRVMQKHGRPASLRHLVPGCFAGTLLILALTAPFLPIAREGLAALLALYLLFLIPASIITAIRTGWSLLLALPAVFSCYHLGYGYGFLFGVWDFLICRRGGRFTTLTRK
ncbi:MAG TPA: glycosyltransferase family 2 protein [Armatimonadota bacterium]|nr:glycosyltransferase family 2 protein [Armatimonadota bacterium]